MKNTLLLLPVITALIFTACEPAYKYKNVSEFNIVENLLENLEEVELIYATGSPKNHIYTDAFIHVMAIRKNSGDTVNILTTFNRGDGSGSSKNVFKFYTPESEEGQKFFQKTHSTDTDAIEIYSIERAFRDPRFDFLANNQHPTTIGFINK
jgi:hypothetical protein